MFSPIDPIAPAIDRVRKSLFNPFDFGKWFVVGFTAFLAGLIDGGGFGGGGSGGGGGNNGFKFNNTNTSSPGDMVEKANNTLQQAGQWLSDNIVLVTLLACVGLLVILTIQILFHWLSARGRFMFLDNVAHDRAQVKRPWAEFRELAWSFFWFRFLFGQIYGLFAFIMVIIAMLPLLAGFLGENLQPSHVIFTVVLAVALLLPVAFLWGVLVTLIKDFIVPIMYLRRVRAMEAAHILRHEILAGHMGGITVYLLVRWGLAIVLGIISLLATCLTCCIAAIPYIGSVILLPLTYFSRCYSLYYLEQYGPEWKIFSGTTPPPLPAMPNIPETPFVTGLGAGNPGSETGTPATGSTQPPPPAPTQNP